MWTLIILRDFGFTIHSDINQWNINQRYDETCYEPGVRVVSVYNDQGFLTRQFVR